MADPTVHLAKEARRRELARRLIDRGLLTESSLEPPNRPARPTLMVVPEVGVTPDPDTAGGHSSWLDADRIAEAAHG